MDNNGIGGGSPKFANDMFKSQGPSRVFRAVVYDVDYNTDSKRHTILVQDATNIGEDGANLQIAHPPALVPYNAAGSGVVSVPARGDECIVAGARGEGPVQILSYAPNAEWAKPEGSRFAEIVGEGGFILKVGGDPKAMFSMSRGGQINMFAGEFARIGVDGSGKKLEFKDKSFEHKSAVGITTNTYFEQDQRTGLAELTSHTASYAQFFENPGNSDIELGTETVNVTALAPYINKALVKAGSIVNKRIDTALYPQHTYQIETRQSTGLNSLSKDTVTTMRFGEQVVEAGDGGAYKYGTDHFTPRGTMWEFEAKKNVIDEVLGIPMPKTNSMVWRYGRLEENVRTRGTVTGVMGAATEHVKGEIFRHQIYEGITPGLYTPLTDPVGEGKGYDFQFPHDTADQQYTESFGIFETPDNSTLDKTVWRKHIHGYETTLTGRAGISMTEVMGADNMYKQTIEETDGIYDKTFTHTVKNDSVTLQIVVGGLVEKKYKIKLGTESIKISVDKGAPSDYIDPITSIELTDAGEILLGGSGQEQQLVTKSWVDLMFANHMHPTAAPGPPSPPIPLPVVELPDNPVGVFTQQTKAE